MLDAELIQQLRTHFSDLDKEVIFAVRNSDHPKQSELLELLEDLAQSSERIHVQVSGEAIHEIHFELLISGSPTGIQFKAIPGGHEFTSLVLAILNANGKGRMADSSLQARVNALRGPVHLRTFVSLECTNCPDVVQALNQMALFNANFTHTTIDGELDPDEVQRLGIQGVPAVFNGDTLVHVGKANFGDLLEALESKFGKQELVDAPSAEERAPYDVLVLGGGPAGASAAIYSARKGLRTAIVAQRIGGQVNDTLGIENLISVSHTQGPKLAQSLREHLSQYSIDLLENRKVESVVDQTGPLGTLKTVFLQGGEQLHTSALIIATGAKWRELGVPGEKEHIGRGVAFCPHCDGPFFANRRVAVVGGGNSGVEAAIDLAGICSHVTLFEFSDQLKADRVLVDKLKTLPNATIITQARTAEIVGDGKSVQAIRYEDRPSKEIHQIDLDGVFVQIGLVPNSAMVKDLVEVNRMGEIVVDSHCRTSVAGIYAAGDVSTVPYKQIVVAMGEGAKAALSAFDDRMRRS